MGCLAFIGALVVTGYLYSVHPMLGGAFAVFMLGVWVGKKG